MKNLILAALLLTSSVLQAQVPKLLPTGYQPLSIHQVDDTVHVFCNGNDIDFDGARLSDGLDGSPFFQGRNDHNEQHDLKNANQQPTGSFKGDVKQVTRSHGKGHGHNQTFKQQCLHPRKRIRQPFNQGCEHDQEHPSVARYLRFREQKKVVSNIVGVAATWQSKNLFLSGPQ